MNFININNNSQIFKFSDAVICNNQDSGLFMPHFLPEFGNLFIKKLSRKTNLEIATDLLFPYLSDLMDWSSLEKVISKSFNFKIPLVQIEENVFALELFHGPTMAFKDVGALFLSNLLQHLNQNNTTTRIMVATSGDTGSAVANAFSNVKGFEVYILYPKNGVSKFQEQQITNTAANVFAIEVDGSFDNCQMMLKSILKDQVLCKELNIITANSINIGRLLPQIVYYFLAYKQLPNWKRELVFSVPSGNLGNLTAGVMAMKMGLPVNKFVSAVNQNRPFYYLLKYGRFQARPSVKTYSNAMDVGNPSNVERLMHLYKNDVLAMTEDIHCRTVSDEQTLKTIRKVYDKSAYLLDPHSAVAYHSLKSGLKAHQNGIFLATASPQKFEDVVKKAIPSIDRSNNENMLGPKIKTDNNLKSLQKIMYEMA